MNRLRCFVVSFTTLAIAATAAFPNASSHDREVLMQMSLRELVEIYRPGFLIGAHTKIEQVEGTLSSTETEKLIAQEYNLISAGIYQKRTQRDSEDDWDFTTVDPIVAYAVEKGLKLYAHPLFGSNNYLPEWLLEGEYSDEEKLHIIEQRIKTIFERYRGKIDIIDVYNEGLERRTSGWREKDNLFISLGYHSNEIGRWPVFLEKILVWSRQYGGDSVKLVYNDNNNTLPGMPQSEDCIRLFRALRHEGIPIDGIGIQCHTKINEENEHRTSGNIQPKGFIFDPGLFSENLRKMRQAGIDVYISECDVHLYGEVTEAKLAAQADAYRDMLKACIQEPACKAFKTWGFTDASCWKPMAKYNPGLDYEPYPLIFDHDLQPKPAYFAMKELVVDLILEKQ